MPVDGVYALNGGAIAPMESDDLTPAISGWAYLLGEPRAETARSRRMARFGGIVAVLALLAYLIWRIFYTIPNDGGYNEFAAWTLVIFEALPIFGLTIRIVTLWNIDSRAPEVVTNLPADFNVVVFIPTYNEPIEVIAPTIAASVALEPRHETWVLDDGDRPWVRELCEQYGARYVRRDEHTHAKAGNINHAMDLMAQEAETGGTDFDVIAVLDCDHVPLPDLPDHHPGLVRRPEGGVGPSPPDLLQLRRVRRRRRDRGAGRLLPRPTARPGTTTAPDRSGAGRPP